LYPARANTASVNSNAHRFSVRWPIGVISTAEKLLLCREPDGSLRTHADLNVLSGVGLNEIVIDRRGNAYVNGAGFDLLASEKFAPGLIALITH
jgi:hypothetical protein